MNWNNEWASSTDPNITKIIKSTGEKAIEALNSPTLSVQSVAIDPLAIWDDKSRDEVLMEWQRLQVELSKLKEAELEFRKYVVKRAFPNPTEGTNKIELGNGYELKAAIKYNYKLDSDNKKIEEALDRIAKIGNQGAFIVERLVSWSPHFLITEYREVCKEAEEGNESAKQILKEVNSILTITDAAPNVEIKEPKRKKS